MKIILNNKQDAGHRDVTLIPETSTDSMMLAGWMTKYADLSTQIIFGGSDVRDGFFIGGGEQLLWHMLQTGVVLMSEVSGCGAIRNVLSEEEALERVINRIICTGDRLRKYGKYGNGETFVNHLYDFITDYRNRHNE